MDRAQDLISKEEASKTSDYIPSDQALTKKKRICQSLLPFVISVDLGKQRDLHAGCLCFSDRTVFIAVMTATPPNERFENDCSTL